MVVVVLLILVELLTIVHLLSFLLIIYHMLIILLYLTKLKFVDIVCPLSFFALLIEMLQERSMVSLQKVPSFHYNPTFNMWRTRNYIYLLSPKQFPYGIVVFD